MTVPTHHPTPEMVLAYSNGGLGEAESLIVAVHLALCPDCRQVANLCDCVGGNMLEAAPAAAVSTSCRDKIFAAIGCDKQENSMPPLPISPDCFIPEPLRGYLNGASCRASVRQLVWTPLQLGVAKYQISLTHGCRMRGAGAQLVQVKSGADFPLAPAAPPSLLLVLCGVLEAGAVRYHAGDFLTAQAMRAGDEDCFCLMVTSGPECPVTGRIKRWLKALVRCR